MIKVAVFVPVSMDCIQEPQIFTGSRAEEDAANAFFEHTGIEYKVFLSAEDQDVILSDSDTIGSKIVTNQPMVQEKIENLTKEDIDYVQEVISNLNDAKYYTDQASDKTLELPGDQGVQIGNCISEIHHQLELIESVLIDTYPQAVE